MSYGYCYFTGNMISSQILKENKNFFKKLAQYYIHQSLIIIITKRKAILDLTNYKIRKKYYV